MSLAPASLESRVERAIASGLAYLTATQTADGNFPTYISVQPDMGGELREDPSVFPAALAAYALGFVPGADSLVERCVAFLLGQRNVRGVWRYWPEGHPAFSTVPPDIDDTSCISLVLNRCGVPGAADRRVLLGNRNRQGLFYTWFLPRRRLTRIKHQLVMLDQWRIIRRQGDFFQGMVAAADDVDAVVNANCLFALGSFRGDRTVIDYLMDVLHRRIESKCDKWYDNPFSVWYSLARALSGRVPGAAELIVERIGSVNPDTPQDFALGMASLIACKEDPPEEWVTRLLAAQLSSGAWPWSPIYSGGRPRGEDGLFDTPFPPGTPFWGSEAVTTALCLQALAQSRQRL